MTKEHSFDISAKNDIQKLKNALNLIDREVANRYDFKNSTHEIQYKEKKKLLILSASSKNKLDALKDILIAKLLKQGLRSKVLNALQIENASARSQRATFRVVDYIEAKKAKKIVSEIKNLKLKVTTLIEGDSIRVKSKQNNFLQRIIKHLQSPEWNAPLVFKNMR